MLTELRIADLGVIDDAVLEFGSGFTVVTGETGAGKTMVVSGLNGSSADGPTPGSCAWGRAGAARGAADGGRHPHGGGRRGGRCAGRR